MTGSADELALHLERVVEAPPARVYAAFVEPAQLAEWWGPAGFTAPGVELDVREGGRYRITMQPPDGDAFHLRGGFLEVDPPRRLAYTFEWEEPTPDDRVTLVEVTFDRRGEATRVVVDQRGFATEARRALHESGWTDTLERLDRFLNRGRR